LACGSPAKGIRAPAWRKQIGRFENRSSRPNRGVIAIGRASRSADGYEDLALRLLSARRFLIISDDRFLPAAVRRRPRRAAEPWPFPALWHLILPHKVSAHASFPSGKQCSPAPD
jgi:hypothetical protein